MNLEIPATSLLPHKVTGRSCSLPTPENMTTPDSLKYSSEVSHQKSLIRSMLSTATRQSSQLHLFSESYCQISQAALPLPKVFHLDFIHLLLSLFILTSHPTLPLPISPSPSPRPVFANVLNLPSLRVTSNRLPLFSFTSLYYPHLSLCFLFLFFFSSFFPSLSSSSHPPCFPLCPLLLILLLSLSVLFFSSSSVSPPVPSRSPELFRPPAI